MSSTPPRVLWVTLDFPPRMSSGMYRPIRIFKYLDRSAFRVDFVTHALGRRFAGAVTDDTVLSEVQPPPLVHRVWAVIPHDWLTPLGARFREMRRRLFRQPATPPTSPAATQVTREPMERRPSLYHRLAHWLYFPDHLFLWGGLTALRCVWLHLRHGYDVIYTTSYPESAHLPGLLLRLFGVRWVAEYRYGGALWIKKLVGYRKEPAREARDRRFQGYVLRHADRVVAQSEQIADDFCREYAVDPSLVHVIPNGYDESDFERHASASAPFERLDHEVHLMHVGVMEGATPSERAAIVEALNRLHASLEGEGHRLVFHAIGSDVLDGTTNPHGIGFDYRWHGLVVHRNLPPYLMAADAFLLSTLATATGGEAIRGFIPGKLWEYLRASKPILMVGPKDAVWSILTSHGVGIDLGLVGEVDVPPRSFLDRVRAVPAASGRVSDHSWESRARATEHLFQALLAARGGARQGDRCA